jgi:regulation of enolase protein 1 (concanavalin A-like superfamily)
MSATAIHTPQLPQDFEKIRQRAQEIYRARGGMMRMTLNDWLKAGLELKQ